MLLLRNFFLNFRCHADSLAEPLTAQKYKKITKGKRKAKRIWSFSDFWLLLYRKSE